MGLIRELRLAGTDYSARVGADSAYAFTGVAPGSFDIVAVMNRNGARVGFRLDPSIDLSKLIAFSLYAMGEGRVYLRFHSRSLNALSGDSVHTVVPTG